jgi:hypothetical protein
MAANSRPQTVVFDVPNVAATVRRYAESWEIDASLWERPVKSGLPDSCSKVFPKRSTSGS